MEKITWRLDIICKDPSVLGNKENEDELVKKFDKFYDLLQKSFRHTIAYKLKLIDFKREVIRSGA